MKEEKRLEKAQAKLEEAKIRLEKAQAAPPRAKRPKLKKDKRVNAGFMSVKNVLCVFLLLLVSHSGLIMVFLTMMQSGMTVYEMAPSLVGYTCLMGFLACLAIMFIQNVSFVRPVRYLAGAARQVARGDFSVRVPAMRKDDKKDYMEVLIDDFNTMTGELSGIDAMKDDFIGNVSHEIKTPLAVVQNYAAALQSSSLTDEERREYLKTIIRASQKLSTLVTNILRLNKLESQGIVAGAAPYDLAEQLRECALAFEEMWEEKGIAFTVDVEDEVQVVYDADMLELVWNNLIGNALKFTEPGGAVTLTQHSGEGAVSVTVADNGCGMDAETRGHIFEKFYQGDTSHAQEGNGLGLAMVGRILDIAGGDIAVESSPGGGTAFTVRLPLAAGFSRRAP